MPLGLGDFIDELNLSFEGSYQVPVSPVQADMHDRPNSPSHAMNQGDFVPQDDLLANLLVDQGLVASWCNSDLQDEDNSLLVSSNESMSQQPEAGQGATNSSSSTILSMLGSQLPERAVNAAVDLAQEDQKTDLEESLALYRGKRALRYEQLGQAYLQHCFQGESAFPWRRDYANARPRANGRFVKVDDALKPTLVSSLPKQVSQYVPAIIPTKKSPRTNMRSQFARNESRQQIHADRKSLVSLALEKYRQKRQARYAEGGVVSYYKFASRSLFAKRRQRDSNGRFVSITGIETSAPSMIAKKK